MGSRSRRNNQRLAVVCLTALAFALLAWPSSSPGPKSAQAGNNGSTKLRAFIHIGPHKTASTHIQLKMCEARDEMRRRGIVVPVSSRCSACHPKHFAAAGNELQGLGKKGRMFACSDMPLQDLKDEIAGILTIRSNNSYTGREEGINSVFLSSEALDNVDEAAVAALASIFSAFDCKIIILHRHKLEHLISYYVQASRPFPSFFLKNKAPSSSCLPSGRHQT
jgi:hypothetical protein